MNILVYKFFNYPCLCSENLNTNFALAKLNGYSAVLCQEPIGEIFFADLQDHFFSEILIELERAILSILQYLYFTKELRQG